MHADFREKVRKGGMTAHQGLASVVRNLFNVPDGFDVPAIRFNAASMVKDWALQSTKAGADVRGWDRAAWAAACPWC